MIHSVVETEAEMSCGGYSSAVERRIVDPNVAGSIPVTHPILCIVL